MIQLDEDFEEYVENNICNNCSQLDIEQDCPYRYYHECPDVKHHIEQTEDELKRQDKTFFGVEYNETVRY